MQPQARSERRNRGQSREKFQTNDDGYYRLLSHGARDKKVYLREAVGRYMYNVIIACVGYIIQGLVVRKRHRGEKARAHQVSTV